MKQDDPILYGARKGDALAVRRGCDEFLRSRGLWEGRAEYRRRIYRSRRDPAESGGSDPAVGPLADDEDFGYDEDGEEAICG